MEKREKKYEKGPINSGQTNFLLPYTYNNLVGIELGLFYWKFFICFFVQACSCYNIGSEEKKTFLFSRPLQKRSGSKMGLWQVSNSSCYSLIDPKEALLIRFKSASVTKVKPLKHEGRRINCQ